MASPRPQTGRMQLGVHLWGGWTGEAELVPFLLSLLQSWGEQMGRRVRGKTMWMFLSLKWGCRNDLGKGVWKLLPLAVSMGEN